VTREPNGAAGAIAIAIDGGLHHEPLDKFACFAEAAARVLLVEQEAEVEAHVTKKCGVPWHGASEGNYVAWSRRVAGRAVRGHILEDDSTDEPHIRSQDLAEDASASTFEHLDPAEVEALPPRRCVMRHLRLVALQNVSPFNKAGSDAPAMIQVVPETGKLPLVN